MRVLRQPTWECLVSYVCSRNAKVERTRDMVEKLAKRFGDPVGGPNGEVRYTFPGTEQLVLASESRLRDDLKLGLRAPSIVQVTERVHGGDLNLDVMRGQSYDNIISTLTESHGVGYKITNCAALFGLDNWKLFRLTPTSGRQS